MQKRLLLMIALLGCSPAVTSDGILQHIKVLSSPGFEGRAPGTHGEEATLAYLKNELAKVGIEPQLQPVSLIAVTSQPSLTLEGKALRPGDDFTLSTFHTDGNAKLENSELVFVGYGAVSPELDDFKDIDVKGKTVVFLAGNRGTAMTWLGRWVYKYEIAAKKGAAAALIIHESGPAGYGWNVVTAGAAREKLEITENASRHVTAEGWLHLDRARELFEDFDRAKASALRPDFRPIPLGKRASLEVKTTSRSITTHNVIGKLAGERDQEYLLYSAHWDHLGRDGQKIYAGALDNASGCAWLLETARAFSKGPRPKRSIVFAAFTAEESGLLGSRYYAQHPIYPLEKTLANINMDIINPWGRTKAIVSVAHGRTTMDETLAEEAAKTGRHVVPDPEPEKGYFYRSDHFELAKRGVPVLGFLFPGAEYIDKPPSYGDDLRKRYVAQTYHTPNDVVEGEWDLSGAVEDTKLLINVGKRIAGSDRWPEWKPGSEFKR